MKQGLDGILASLRRQRADLELDMRHEPIGENAAIATIRAITKRIGALSKERGLLQFSAKR